MTAPTAEEIRQAIEDAGDDRKPHSIDPAEITAAIEARLGQKVVDADQMEDVRGLIRQAITHSAASPLINSAVDTLEIGGDGVWEDLNELHPDALWTDLRASQAKRLVELVGEACNRAAAMCTTVIVDELTKAGVAFAAEYPDAPRPKVEAVAA